jgi:hypothetical protein
VQHHFFHLPSENEHAAIASAGLGGYRRLCGFLRCIIPRGSLLGLLCVVDVAGGRRRRGIHGWLLGNGS